MADREEILKDERCIRIVDQLLGAARGTQDGSLTMVDVQRIAAEGQWAVTVVIAVLLCLTEETPAFRMRVLDGASGAELGLVELTQRHLAMRQGRSFDPIRLTWELLEGIA